MYGEILRYMGHKGDADTQIIKIISSCLEKLAVANEPRYVIKQVDCAVSDNAVTLDTLSINSGALAAHLLNCESVYVMAATLGASVDRLIAQRSIVDSLEALCLQACATAKIEEYCDSIENELKVDAKKKDLQITTRFSPGYADFDIEHQSDILKLLDAQKKTGVTVTKSHMLSPLKTITAVIGLKNERKNKIRENPRRTAGTHSWTNKCDFCQKPNCQFHARKDN